MRQIWWCESRLLGCWSCWRHARGRGLEDGVSIDKCNLGSSLGVMKSATFFGKDAGAQQCDSHHFSVCRDMEEMRYDGVIF